MLIKGSNEECDEAMDAASKIARLFAEDGNISPQAGLNGALRLACVAAQHAGVTADELADAVRGIMADFEACRKAKAN